MAFQLVDDVLDYSGESSGKSMAADLREGKLTLPLILATVRHPELVAPVRRIHAGDLGPLDFVRESVVASGACEAVRVRAQETTDRALEELQLLTESPAKSMLVLVARELVARIH